MDLRTFALPCLFLLLACGSGLSSKAFTLDGGRPDRGYTACGEATCAPGEYCDSATFSVCLEGCKSDDNCAQGFRCHPSSTGSAAGTCGTPGAVDGDPCDEAGSKCLGGLLTCYFGEGDTKGTCRQPCGSSFDCKSYSYDCCPVSGFSTAACVPEAIAPKDGTCR